MRTKLYVVTSEPIPNGHAASNRIISYSNALSKYIDIEILVIRPSGKSHNSIKADVVGSVDNVKYVYPGGIMYWHGSKMHKAYQLIVSYCSTIHYIVKKRPSAIHIYSHLLSARIIITALCRLLKIKMSIEENEYPKEAYLESKLIRYIYVKIYSIIGRMVVISSELSQYYKGLGVDQVFMLPMSVDMRRFTVSRIKYSRDFVYIGGNGGFVRDGVEYAIEAFRNVLTHYPDARLRIVGMNMIDNNRSGMNDSVHCEKAYRNIIFEGDVQRENIPVILSESCAALITPGVNYKSGGFPTKLGEYLASAIPVIVSPVSDIAQYLDKESAFLVRPMSIDDITNAMIDILSNPDRAEVVGQEGRQVCLRNFNPDLHARELVKFLLN